MQADLSTRSEAAELEARAASGDIAAQTEIGARMLMGKDAPLAPAQGVDLLVSAAANGSARAADLMAILAGAGIARPQSWPDALGYLAQAAEFGFERARRELLLLSADRELANKVRSGEVPSPDLWRGLADTVDVAGWISPPPRRAVCEAPRIRVVDRFAPPELCEWLIERARGKLSRATMYNPATGRDEYFAERSNSAFVFDLLEADFVTVLLRARISEVVKLPTFCFEPTQVFHYQQGQQIGPHFDYLERPPMQTYTGEGAYEGQRVATFLVYLNGDFEGGETEFPKVGYKFRGGQGDAIYFANVDAAGAPEKLSLHAGRPPTRGEKWIISQWIHDRPFTAVL